MRRNGQRRGADDATVRNARWALGLVFFINGAIFASWAARIPAIANDLQLTSGALGFALFCQASGTPLAMPVCGAMVARFGSRPVTRTVLLVACLALPLPAIAPNLWVLAPTLALLGGGVGALVVAQNAQGVAIEKIGERPILPGLHGLLSLGWLGGSLVGSGAASTGLPPLVHFAAVSASLLVLGLFATKYLLAARLDRDSAGPTFAKPSAGLAMLAVISFCCLLAEGSVMDWGAVYLKGTLGAGQGIAALGPAAFAAAETAGRLSGNRLVARLGSSILVRGAAILAVSGMLVAIVVSHPGLGVAGFGLLGAGLSVIFPLLLSVAGADTTPEARESAPGTRIAAVATAGFVGLLSGPALIGALAQLYGLWSALIAVALLVAVIPSVAGWVSVAKTSQRQ